MDGRIAQLISRAEHFIAEQRYEKASACLVAAEQIEPGNPSVRMLKGLLSTLQSQTPKRTFLMRFFPRTQRKESEASAAKSPLPEGELRKRITNLTGTAEHFLSRGAVESAYESMMRASLLDPSAPEVIACEQRVIPAWKRLRGQHAEDSKPKAAFQSLPVQKRIQSSLLERLKNGKLLT